jgi:hypothetical protein
MLALLRVKEKVIAIVAKRQSTNGAEQKKSTETKPVCTRCGAFRPLTTLPPEWQMKIEEKSTAPYQGNTAVGLRKKPCFVSGHDFSRAANDCEYDRL